MYKLRSWINKNNLNFSNLSLNPNAIDLLEKNQDNLNWFNLSENPNAIDLLEQNLDKINWSMLSLNPNAIRLLEQNQDKINWELLSTNPNIFEIDYDFLRNRLKNSFSEELMMNLFHPSNFDKWTDWGFDIF